MNTCNFSTVAGRQGDHWGLMTISINPGSVSNCVSEEQGGKWGSRTPRLIFEGTYKHKALRAEIKISKSHGRVYSRQDLA